ncbi:MAG: alpha/beta hydrolase [Clostridia bacterium]|nr:alpha/beta hydrolase [Clostridia bacterium]
MTRSEMLFQFIDTVWHPWQNYRRYKAVTIKKDVVYDESRKDVCKGNVYFRQDLVDSGKKLPVVVYYHGGGFVRGDKKHRNSFCKMIADHGYFVYNVNYGLGPKDIFPQGSRDCVNAVNFLQKLAKDYPIDLSKVCVTGDSAGGYYAAHVTALSNDASLRQTLGVNDFAVRPALFVGGCGMYDPPKSIGDLHLPFHYVWDIGRCFLGSTEEFTLKKDCSNTSDYKYINEIAPARFVNDNWQPAFLIISTNDMFCPNQGEMLEQALKDAGVDVESFYGLTKNDGHCFHLDLFRKSSKQCMPKMFAFMDKYLMA